MLVVTPVIALALAAIIVAIVQIFRTPQLDETERWVWVIALVFFPVVAALVWFFAGPHPFGLRITRHLR